MIKCASWNKEVVVDNQYELHRPTYLTNSVADLSSEVSDSCRRIRSRNGRKPNALPSPKLPPDEDAILTKPVARKVYRVVLLLIYGFGLHWGMTDGLVARAISLAKKKYKELEEAL